VSDHIVLISGERGTGKTTVCRKVVAHAKAAGHACGGLLTLRGDETDQRIVVDVHTDEMRPLTVTEGGVRQGRFLFDPAALEWGTDALTRSLPCDLLVIDEIGPLEIEQHSGWAATLDLLRLGQFRLALVVVRPELIRAAQLRLPRSAPTVVTVTPENRDQLPVELLGMLERET
jgi:nucleoside-triphosphatase